MQADTQDQKQNYYSVLLLTASTVENGISLYSCHRGLTWHGLIGGQHVVGLEIVNCVQKLKLTRHKCCVLTGHRTDFPPENPHTFPVPHLWSHFSAAPNLVKYQATAFI